MAGDTQKFIDKFYFANGDCCAGCDWWESFNGVAGQCTRSAPVAGHERYAMLADSVPTLEPHAGHIFTRRDHLCGDFKDDFDWSSLPLTITSTISFCFAVQQIKPVSGGSQHTGSITNGCIDNDN